MGLIFHTNIDIEPATFKPGGTIRSREEGWIARRNGARGIEMKRWIS
jgi:hypothetical protein